MSWRVCCSKHRFVFRFQAHHEILHFILDAAFDFIPSPIIERVMPMKQSSSAFMQIFMCYIAYNFSIILLYTYLWGIAIIASFLKLEIFIDGFRYHGRTFFHSVPHIAITQEYNWILNWFADLQNWRWYWLLALSSLLFYFYWKTIEFYQI